jgi:hypothetical protein
MRSLWRGRRRRRSSGSTRPDKSRSSTNRPSSNAAMVEAVRQPGGSPAQSAPRNCRHAKPPLVPCQRSISCGRTLARASFAGIRRAQRFRPMFQTEQHASRHEKSRRLDRMRRQLGPGTSRAHAAARDELCSVLVDWVKTKLPDPIKVPQVPHVQHERATGLDGCHRPAWAAPEGNSVPDGEVL